MLWTIIWIILLIEIWIPLLIGLFLLILWWMWATLDKIETFYEEHKDLCKIIIILNICVLMFLFVWFTTKK
mgnify:CR=1 FL=1